MRASKVPWVRPPPSVPVSSYDPGTKTFTKFWLNQNLPLLPKKEDAKDILETQSNAAPYSVPSSPKIEIITNTPTIWYNWSSYKKEKPIPSVLILRMAAAVTGGGFNFHDIPTMRINWNHFYKNNQDYVDSCRQNTPFITLVLQWLSTFVKFRQIGAAKGSKEEQEKWKDLDIDPFKAKLQHLKPTIIMGNRAAIEKHYTTIIYEKCLFPVPCLEPPILALVLGGQHEFLSTSSVGSLSHLYQIFDNAMVFNSYIYPAEIREKNQNSYNEQKLLVYQWYKDGLKHLIESYSSLLFQSSGAFVTMFDIKEMTNDYLKRMSLKNFVAAFSSFQQEYYRRLANLVEIVCYQVFFGLSLWKDVGEPLLSEQVKFATFAKYEPLNHPDYTFSIYKNLEYGVHNASEAKIAEGERMYNPRKKDDNGAESIWSQLITQNLSHVMRTADVTDSNGIQDIPTVNLSDGKSKVTQLSTNYCSSTLPNILIGLSQYIYAFHNKNQMVNPIGHNHFLVKFADNCSKSQIGAVESMIEMIVKTIGEKSIQVTDGSVRDWSIKTHFTPNGTYTKALLDQFVSLYGKYREEKNSFWPLLNTTLGQIIGIGPDDSQKSHSDDNIWEDLDPSIAACFGKYQSDRQKQNETNAEISKTNSFGRTPDYLIRPYCAILHTQMAYLHTFML